MRVGPLLAAAPYLTLAYIRSINIFFAAVSAKQINLCFTFFFLFVYVVFFKAVGEGARTQTAIKAT